MGQAKSLAIRHQAIELRSSGQTFESIALALNVSVRTCKTYWKRYREGGKANLGVRYSACGRRVDASKQTTYRLVRLLKHLHSTWGIPCIVHKIKDKYPQLPLQSIRQYQRRLNLYSETMPKSILPVGKEDGPPRTAHDTWQIDAKERLVLKDGQGACYLTICDEATGSILAAELFPLQPD